MPLVELPLRVQHDPRLLRGRPAVEVDERTAFTHRAAQQREVRADPRELALAERPRRHGGVLRGARVRGGPAHRHTSSAGLVASVVLRPRP
ncbi:hypothetical protein [Ornithinimicrobium kibberense]|uniref:hypothetical protein n=1 Tax=Ornithinimicrobium kibberense TaxID=282060 RepID=UPI00361E3C03